jgi:apolipoprotein N-acyltransferase
VRLPLTDWGLIAAAAVLLTLAYPPFELVVPAFVCLIPAALLILRGRGDADPWRRHLHQGFWYGLIVHGVLLYWFAGALWQYGRSTVALYAVAAVMFGGGTAPMFAIVGRIVAQRPGRLIVALPAGVVFLEWLAAQVGPIGFPWHQLALSVSSYPVLLQTADLAGAGGLGFILAAINVLLAMAWWTRHRRGVALAHVEVAATVLFCVTLYGLHRLNTLPLEAGVTVAVVQPNVTVDEKWSPRGQDEIVERTARLTERAIDEVRPEFIAWPETALPDAIRMHPRWAARITQMAMRSGSTVLTGGVDMASSGDGSSWRYNAAFEFSPTTRAEAVVVHHKQKLIPMIEWVPGSLDLSRTGFGGFTPGRTVQVATSTIGRYGTLLCYELTFADMARTLRRNGAEVLVALSNDAWFGRTSAPHQHFAHAALRAVENRISVIRAANTGVSGIVDPLGRVVTRTDPFVETYATGQVLRSSVVPLAVHLGGLVGPISLGLLLLLLLPLRLTSAPRGT